MDPQAIVVGRIVGDTAVHEHAGERSDAELADVLAGKEAGFGIDDGLAAGVDVEAVGTGQRGAVEQRQHGHAGRVRFGLDQPEFAKGGEFLTVGFCSIDGQASGREAVPLASTHHAEVRGAEKDHELVAVLATVQGIVEAEAA